MINETYWNDYYNFWDTFVKDWYDFISRGKTISERAFVSFGRASCINVDELPEPYLGSPVGNVEAVFLNLNPGMCQKGKYGIYKGKNLEATKFYSNIDKPDESVPNGWLIKEFSDEAKCSYKEFVSKWSCLNPELRWKVGKVKHEVCGVEWWQGNEANVIGGRMKWVRQIYGNNQLCPSHVFAPEMCPFHSAKWDFDILEDSEIVEHIVSHVLNPAIVATHQHGLQFAIAIGKTFRDILEEIMAEKVANVSAIEEEKWYCKVNEGKRELSDNSLLSIWPTNDDWKFTIRSYYLYKVTVNNDITARILVTYAPGGNTPPAEDFRDVEERIRQSIASKYVSANRVTQESKAE